MKKGAKKQRLLWASTSVKNPAYPDTLYVAPLIGPDTVSRLEPDIRCLMVIIYHDLKLSFALRGSKVKICTFQSLIC